MEKELLKVEEFGKIFFRDHARHVAEHDREDVLGAARLILANQEYDVSRASRNTLVQRTIQWAYKAHVDQSRRMRMLQEEARFADEKFERVRSMADVLDPDDGPGKAGFLGIHVEDLRSPPYRVEWRGAYSHHVYLDEPYFVPPFAVVPTKGDRCALRPLSDGSYRFIDEGHLSEASIYALDSLRARYASALHVMISEYLEHHGWTTLPRPHKAVLARFNRGLSASQIQREIGIKESTYYSHMRAIRRRGWMEEWHGKKQRMVLRYHPAMDAEKRLHNKAIPVRTDGLSLRERIEATGAVPSIEKLLSGQPDSQMVEEYLAFLDREVEETRFSVEALVGHDERLRAFVERLVRRPVIADDLSFEQAMALLVDLPEPRQKAVIFGAVEMNKSIADMFGIGDYFPELYEETEVEPMLLSLAS